MRTSLKRLLLVIATLNLLVSGIIILFSMIGASIMNHRKYTLILTGFGWMDEKGVAGGEIAPFYAKLDNHESVIDQVPMCETAYKGQLYDSNVLLVSTGMAKVKTTACLLDILEKYKGQIKEVLFSGIGGITPMKGGMLSKDGTLRNGEKAMLGDLCISSSAYDFDLQHYGSDTANSRLQTPSFWPQDSAFTSQFSNNKGVLVNELLSASKVVAWPDPPEKVKEIDQLYHGVTGKNTVWDPTVCVEASGDLFWHDVSLDKKARVMGADFLTSLNQPTKEDGIFIITAMEALPVGAVVEWWNKEYNDEIPFAYVRGASNFDHPYIHKDGTPAESAKSSLERFHNSGGGTYAITNASLPILKMLEIRKNK